jgi:hypothetical protein
MVEEPVLSAAARGTVTVSSPEGRVTTGAACAVDGASRAAPRQTAPRTAAAVLGAVVTVCSSVRC